MKDACYKRLARHLDTLPGGFPPTEDGVELRILERLFTPAQAELACHLTLLHEKPAVIALRSGLSVAEVAPLLAEMAEKGLIFSKGEAERRPTYMAAQFAVGIWEYQVGRLTPGLAEDMGRYLPQLLNHRTWRKAPQMRVVPVARSIEARQAILTHERAAALLEDQNDFTVMPCICRRERGLLDAACGKPVETCIAFSGAGDYFQRTGAGRPASRDEVLALLHQADRAGLVIQPSNSKRAGWICCCCGCCCGVLRTLRRAPRPALLVATPFVAVMEANSCNGCGTCLKRCQMDAFTREADTIRLDPQRCIGCGLCVSTCPTKALCLVRKPREVQPLVPSTVAASMLRLAWKRRQTGPLALLRLLAGSQKDRLRVKVKGRGR
jgi:ferredoxin